jgi:NTE family protein
MLSNYPMQLFDRTDGKAPRWPTFGVKLSAAPPQDGADSTYPVTNLVELAKRLVTTMVEAHDRTYVSQDSVRERTIFVDTDGISATDFDLSELNRDLLFKAGLQAGEEFARAL